MPFFCPEYGKQIASIYLNNLCNGWPFLCTFPSFTTSFINGVKKIRTFSPGWVQKIADEKTSPDFIFVS